MTVEAFDRVLLDLRYQKPFQVFSVILNTGDEFQVDHADAFFVRDGVAVYLAPGGHLK